MVFEIVRESHVVVPESAIDDSNQFKSPKEQICDNHWFYFGFNEEYDELSIYLYVDCPLPVTVTWFCTVNFVTQKKVFIYNDHHKEGYTFGEKYDLIRNGSMKFDSTLIFKFTSELPQLLKTEVPHTFALLNDEKFTDFIICADGQEIKVHKNIISVASPVFAAMLESHTKEAKEGKVEIEDFDFQTIKVAMSLMYTRKLEDDLSIKTLLNVGKFADKYDLMDMKKIVDKLYEKINLATILEISTFSKANGMDELYDKCVNFFVTNFEANTQKMNDFKQLDSQFIKDAVMKKYRPNEM